MTHHKKWQEIKTNRYITRIDKSHKGIQVCDKKMKNKYKEINFKPRNKRRLCSVHIFARAENYSLLQKGKRLESSGLLGLQDCSYLKKHSPPVYFHSTS